MVSVRNKTVLFGLLFYVAVLLITNLYIMSTISELKDNSQLAARAYGQINFCLNHAPELNYTCDATAYEGTLYDCQVNVTDMDYDGLNFSLTYISGPYEFNITHSGLISFTPNQSYVGNHSFIVTVWDNSSCSNSVDSGAYNLEILNVNNPPILIRPIPNQSWPQDTTLRPFDLDDYFWDPDGDPLTFTNDLLSDIRVDIDSNNWVTFDPIAGFSGKEYIHFYAWDPYNANATSNRVELEVRPIKDKTGGGGGGGGGGGSGASEILTCLPRWYCRPWGQCEPDNLRRRECYDLNNCSTTLGKPNLTEYCEFQHTCYDGYKAPDEIGIDCGGPCPPCGTCYDDLCNNGEDCTKDLIAAPDCGGPCQPCVYPRQGTCYDNICNNDEDCTRGETDVPDCGGPCDICPTLEKPVKVATFNWFLILLPLLLLIVLSYVTKKSYKYLKEYMSQRKQHLYEERLLLEAKVSESILDSLSKLESLLDTEDIQRLIAIFSAIVRRYFKSLLNLSYELTYEEVTDELYSRNVSPTLKLILVNFFSRSLDMEFSGKNATRAVLREMVAKFKKIVAYTSEKKVVENIANINETKAKLTKYDKLFMDVSEAETLLRHSQFKSAMDIYKRTVKGYESLSEKDKERLQPHILQLYELIMKAINR